MLRTHFLIAPIRLESNFKMHREVYGCTRMSGVEIDVVNYQTAAFVPCDYHVVDDMKTLLLQYRDAADLAEKLQAQRGVMNEAVLDVDTLQEYDKSYILERLGQMVSALIETRNPGLQ